jgi:hypothetical protein
MTKAPSELTAIALGLSPPPCSRGIFTNSAPVDTSQMRALFALVPLIMYWLSGLKANKQ